MICAADALEQQPCSVVPRNVNACDQNINHKALTMEMLASSLCHVWASMDAETILSRLLWTCRTDPCFMVSMWWHVVNFQSQFNSSQSQLKLNSTSQLSSASLNIHCPMRLVHSSMLPTSRYISASSAHVCVSPRWLLLVDGCILGDEQLFAFEVSMWSLVWGSGPRFRSPAKYLRLAFDPGEAIGRFI